MNTEFKQSKRTPGTWSVDNHKYFESECIQVKAMGDTGVCLIAKHDLEGEEEANAKLISAAPDLLEALIKLRNHPTPTNMDIADKAIEKALK